MDDIAAYNVERWNAMARAEALFTRPFLDLTPESARARLDREGWLGDVYGKRVLCLASGGGRQSACFALLGAHVTVLDLSEAVLRGDQAVARHYQVVIQVEQGDMRDLSAFTEHVFDIVWHPYSINFVPDALAVFDQVARVLRPGGSYTVMMANPSAMGIGTGDWTGDGYLLRYPYLDGAQIEFPDQPWVFREAGASVPISPVREYRHTLGTVVNGLAMRGFTIEHLTEERHPVEGAKPGSWHHLVAMIPPWMTFWTRYRPGLA